MKTVTSKDGTTIAFDQVGTGPILILIGGALQYRAGDPGTAKLADLLSPDFTVVHYDRRGRGDSTDTQPYAVEREIEDIEAIIDALGGTAYLFGNSSGGALAMEAAIVLGDKVKKLAMYEVPFNDEATARQTWKEYKQQLNEALDGGRKGDAAALFLTLVGMPLDQINGMRHAPFWPAFEAVAPTLAYDHIYLLGEDASIPTERASKVLVPTLVMNGSASYPFMQVTAQALSKVIPKARHHILEGQTHEVSQESLAPVLDQFFAA